MLMTLALAGCGDDAEPRAEGEPPATTTPSPTTSSPTSSPSSPTTAPAAKPAALRKPGQKVTDLNGPTDIDVSFVVPRHATEVDDGPGKRAFEVGQDGWIMVGAVDAYFRRGKNDLLQRIEVGNDPAAALAAVKSRGYDLRLVAQGQVDVVGESALVMGFRTKPKVTNPSDLWCFVDEISCYKMPPEITGNQVLVPWGDRLLLVHMEWTGAAAPPERLTAARDALLTSLRRA